MTNPDQVKPLHAWLRPVILIGIVALAAVVMGLPTLRGGFVGGDDHRLVIDHVLVNRPSLAHAVNLFTIVHRDLYQPLPLLMFSGEMAIAKALNLFESGSQGGAWLFHLTNILLHALVTVLVWHTIRMLDSRAHARSPFEGEGRDEGQALVVASLVALIFAVHPLNVETVAWVNGRMMLLSTLFGLAGILAFARWVDRGSLVFAFLTLLCFLLSALSKVRVGLPLLLLVMLMRGDWRKARGWPVWIVAGTVMAFFAWINVGATSQADLFSDAAEHLQGPRAVRVLLALEFYFTHVVWPFGLASYYPTPPVVTWSDAGTLRAILVVGLAFVLLGIAAWKVRAARWGIAWFFIAIADTLPFVPARNVLAADRYVYLALPGLLWTLVATVRHIRQGISTYGAQDRFRLAVAMVSGFTLTLIGVSWYTAYWYNTPELKTERVARVFPEIPRVWERYGWTQYSNGDYEKAIELAAREFGHEIPAVQSGAHQLIGMSRFKQGKTDEALIHLHKALEIDPENDLGRFRLGMVYEELGRFAEALPLYEACVRSATSHNPTLHRLARVYREQGSLADARAMYEQELKNNPYEAPASIALADLDFQEGTPDSLRAAEHRLLELLEWMPENASARINLGTLYDTVGDASRAELQFELARQLGFESFEQAQLVHEFFEKKGDFAHLAELWLGYLIRNDDDALARSFLAWALVIAGKPLDAREQIARIGVPARDIPIAQAAVALLALEEGREDMVQPMGDRLATNGDAATRRRLLRALERFDARKPGNPWTYYLTAVVLHADGQLDAARAFLDLFTSRCSGASCAAAKASLESKLQS